MSHAFSISSKDGWNRVTVTASKVVLGPAGRRQLAGGVAIRSLFWSRPDAIESGTFEAPPVEDLAASIPQVVLDVSALERLRSLLQQWLIDHSEFEVELAKNDAQQLSIAAGDRAELICSLESPALTLRYRAERVQALEVYFLVDQSCISAALEELEALLEATRSRSGP